MDDMTEAQAIELAKTGWWKGMDAKEIATFQLYTPLLCMDFGDFHAAMEKALGRPVWTHEFAWSEHLKDELRGEKGAPSMDEIMNLIPEEKRIIITKE